MNSASVLQYQDNSQSIQKTYSLENVPFVAPEAIDEIFEERALDNGDMLQVAKLNLKSLQAIMEMYAAERKNLKNVGKNYLLDRNEAAIIRMFEKGDVLACLVNGHMASIGAVTRIADIGDMGRGRPYTDNGNCPPSQQSYFKSALVHPDMQNSQIDVMGAKYPHRLACALKMQGRTCFLTKSNHPSVKKAYGGKLNWLAVDSCPTPEDPESENKLVTFKISDTEALAQLQNVYPAVYQRHIVDIMKVHSADVAEPTTMETYTLARISNDNARTQLTPVPYMVQKPF